MNGAKRFMGEMKGLIDGNIVITVSGEELSFPQKSVSMVRPYIDFDEDDLKDELPEGK